MKKIYSILIVALCIFTVNAQTLDRSIRPSSGPAKEINIKDAEIFTLKNGLKVFLVEDKSTPLMYYSLQLDVKPALEGDKAGMHDMFNDVFGKMTKSRTKEQLNRDLDLIAMRGGANRGGGYAYFLKKYQDKALDILSDMILNPVFSQEEFDLALGRYKTNLASMGDDAGQINDRVGSALIYGKGFPSGQVETIETLDNIRLSDLENYYATYFAPNVGRLVIVGDINKKDAKEMAEKYFGSWEKKNVVETKYEIPVAPANRKVAFMNKPGVVQSAIDICYPIQYSIAEPDYDAAAVMSQILGGSGTGHLFLNLREDKSWTYGIYTHLAPGELVGSFSLTSGRGAASVKAVATDSAVYEIFKELDRIINEPVTEKELSDAKTFRAGNFSRSLEDSETIARFAVNIDKYNLPKDYYKNYLKRLDAITPADIQAAAKKYIKPENAWIVVTTDRQYADKLAQFAGDGKVQWYDYDANPIETPVAQEVAVSGEQVIANYIKALGGQSAIDNVNDFQVNGEMEMMGQVVSMKEYFQKPNHIATVIEMQGMTVQKVAFDGTTMRVSGMQGSQEVTDENELASLKESAGVCPEANYIANGYTLTVTGIEPVNGSDAYVMTVTKDDSSSVEYYDVASGLKVRMMQTEESPMGEMQVFTDYADYREVDGVKFPFSKKQSAMGQVMERTVLSVEVNKGIDASVFK